MSTSLPQEVQTSKVTSLPDDLKAIAEAMLKDKFGVKEVVPDVDDFFLHPADPRRFTEFRDGPHPLRNEPSMGSERGGRSGDVGLVRVTNEPWSHSRVAEVEIFYPSFENILIAKAQMEMNGIRWREQPRLVMNPEFYRFIRTDSDARLNFVHYDEMGPGPIGLEPTVGQLAGCAVVVSRDVKHAILVAEF